MKEFRNILYLADPSRSPDPGFERAVALAENNQARLTVLYAWEDIPEADTGPGGDLQGVLWRKCLERFEALSEPFRGRAELDAKVVFGRPFVEVIREVLNQGRDLVIKTAEGDAGLRKRLFGSTDMHLLRKCPCPVWLLKPTHEGPYHRIMAAVDFNPSEGQTGDSPLNSQVLDLALSLAISEFAQLHVVHAWDAVAESALRVWGDSTTGDLSTYVETERRRHKDGLDRLMEALGNRAGADGLAYARPRLHLPRGPARYVIPALAADLDVDLVVMGTVGRTGIPGLLIGNTAETILNEIECSVLAVKPPGFISPVQPA